MINSSLLSIYLIHYSKLKDRREFLSRSLLNCGIQVRWITEKDAESFSESSFGTSKIFGVSKKIIGMDLGVNSRSLVTSRRKARLQGYILFLRSYITKQSNTLTTGSLPTGKPLPRAQIEVQHMHLTALKAGVESNSDWILVLEDDVLPIDKAFNVLNQIIKVKKPMMTWINLNSGAGLQRTSSDPQPDQFGLFRVKPASTRCVTAYLVSQDLAKKILELVNRHGIPNWLPIDVAYQAALRKLRAKAYWQEPVTFIQGSESGAYLSSLDGKRG
jgi:hypothetical protein